MTGVDTARDVAVLWTLDFDAELPCEADHVGTNTVCSAYVSHFATNCTDKKVVCKNGANYVQKWMNYGNAFCPGCDNPVENCWSIRPI